MLTWGASIVGGGLFLWLTSLRVPLYPDDLSLPGPWFVALALLVHVPYALVRALRLRYLLDPVVAAATDGARSRLRRGVLHGSGLVSFLVLIVLPLKLGEFSRPLLLARAKEPGVGFAESLSAVATERIIDGLMICAMLFGGLALAGPLTPDSAGAVVEVHAIGRGMLVLFVVGLVGLLGCAAWPARATAIASRLPGPLGPRAAAILARLVEPVRPLLELRRAVPLVGWSALYWAITVAQLWLVLRGCGVELGPAAAAAIVAIVGLSIQLPGGPAQAGTFQIGAGMALALFLTPDQLAGAGSRFSVVMYVLILVGSAVMALPGLWLLRRAEP